MNKTSTADEIEIFDELWQKHYIRINEYGHIILGFSDAFEQPKESDILINAKGGLHFRFKEGGIENPILFTDEGIPLYRWDNTVIQRTAEELQADIDNIPHNTVISVEYRLEKLEEVVKEIIKQTPAIADTDIAQMFMKISHER